MKVLARSFVLVLAVTAGAPGLGQWSTATLSGDLILEFGGQEACHAECLVAAHTALGKMDSIRVTFLRGGERREVVLDVTRSHRSLLE